MKNAIIIVLLIAAAGLGALVIQKNQQAAQAEAKRLAAETALKDLQTAKAEQDQQTAALREKLETAQAESAANAGTAAKLTVALTNTVAAETNAKPANPFAEMFKNPEMREMIKQQQKTMLGGMLDKNYADFFKAMNLTSEQTAAMKELIMNKMLGGAELGMEMMSGEMTTEQRTELTKKMKEATDTINQQLKDLLGAENYSQFENYEKSIPDRMALEQFKGQLTADLALNANQEQSLLDAISAERQGFKFTTDFSNQQDFSEDMFSKFTEERMSLYFQEQDQLNQRILARAQPLLSPNQYAAYQRQLKSQQEMLKATVPIAAKMFRR